MHDVDVFFQTYPDYSEEAFQPLIALLNDCASDPPKMSSIRQKIYAWQRGDLFTVLLSDASTEERLSDIIRCLQNMDITQVEETGEYAGLSVVHLILRHLKGKEILTMHPELLDAINLNQVYPSFLSDGDSLACTLLRSSQILEFHESKPNLFDAINMNQICKTGEHKGATPAWFLAAHSEGQKIYKKYPALLENINLNATPVGGVDAGKSIAWLLGVSELGGQLFKDSPQLLQGVNLAQAPSSGIYAGWSLAARLIHLGEGIDIFESSPDLLLSLNVFHSAYGIGLNAVKSGLSVLRVSGAVGLVKCALLFNADPLMVSPTEGRGRVDLMQIQRSLKSTVNKIISLYYHELKTHLEYDDVEKIAFNALVDEHTELHFMAPLFSALMTQELGFDVTSKFDRLANLLARGYYDSRNIPPPSHYVSQLHHELLTKALKKIALQQSWPSTSNHALRDSLMDSLNRCEHLARANVENALREAYVYWQHGVLPTHSVDVAARRQPGLFENEPRISDNKRSRDPDTEDGNVPVPVLRESYTLPDPC